MDTYTYKAGAGPTYINLTNECTNDCAFCLRRKWDGVWGYDLRLEREPDAGDVIRELETEKPAEVVFCGLGEPTLKIGELKEIAAFVKSYGGRVRVNTNGHASVFHGRDIAAELAGLADEVSISLNGADAAGYERLTHCRYGKAGYGAMLDFARRCAEEGMEVTLSVVDVISPEEIEVCRGIAKDAGARFRARGFVGETG